MLSTLDAAIAQAYERADHRLPRVIDIRAITLVTVLSNAGLKPPLSVLSLDVESRELSALKPVDLADWRPDLVCLM